MRNKKGFTLVELVIVIAVIAILAGVMIGTFASVVKKAQKSAEQQEMAAAKQEQVANDVLEKLNNQNWLGWEDFEEKLAKALADVNPNTSSLTEASVKAAVASALNEYAAAHPGSENPNTGLTEAQVKYIVENALSGQLTAAQVKAIVASAVSGTSTLTKAQVQTIIDAAVGKTLTASQVKNAVSEVIASEKLSKLTEADLEEKLEAILSRKNYSTLTEKEIDNIIKEALKNYSVKSTEVSTAGGINEVISKSTESTVVLSLANDIKETAKINVTKNTVIDLDVHTLDLANANVKIEVESGATLTIKGSGEIIGKGNAFFVKGNGQLVIDGGDFVNTTKDEKVTEALIGCGDNSFVTINGGNYTVEGMYYIVFAAKDSTTVINGGTFRGIGVGANASTDGTGTENAVCIINGGTFVQDIYNNSKAEPAVFWPKGNLSIYGGTFTGTSTALAICGGKVNLYGGTFTSTGTGTQIGKGGTFTKDGDVICVITARAGGTSYALESVFISKNIVVNPVAGAKAVSVYPGGSTASEFGTATKTYETITEDITITK